MLLGDLAKIIINAFGLLTISHGNGQQSPNGRQETGNGNDVRCRHVDGGGNSRWGVLPAKVRQNLPTGQQYSMPANLRVFLVCVTILRSV